MYMYGVVGAAIIIPIVVILVLTSDSSSEPPRIHTQQPTTCTNTSTGSGSDYNTSIAQNTTLCHNTSSSSSTNATATPTPTPTTPTSTPVPIPISSGSLAPLPNFPLSCQHVAMLRPGWNPRDEAENGHNGVYHTKKSIEWGSYYNQAFPNQTLIFKIATRKDQHWNISYIDYQLHHNITLKGCAIVADVTSPTGYWEYWGIHFPSTYPLDWSRGSSSAIGNEQIHWTYGPDVYPAFQPRIKTYIDIIPRNITGKEPITCTNGTYVCTGIGQIGWTYNATSGVNKTITGLTQECYAQSLGDINGCQTYYKHKNRFPPSKRPDPIIEPDPSPVIRACGNDTSYQLCQDGTCIWKNQTCSRAITCLETRDCPTNHVCRSADYDDPHSFFRTCQVINHLNYCPTLAYQPWTQVECDRLVAGRPYVGWTACDQYLDTPWHSGCRTDYCQRDCLASYVIISCQDMFNDGSIQACPFGASPGYSPFVPGECICSDSWSTL